MRIYLDDIVYLSSSQAIVEKFKQEMKQTGGNEFITKRRYVEETLKLFKMHQCKPVTTPMNFNERFQVEDDTGTIDSRSYRSLVGRLLNLTHTRPDIACTVNMLSRFVSKPTRKHLGAVKHLLRYIARTSFFGIRYTKTEDCKLRSFTNSD